MASSFKYWDKLDPQELAYYRNLVSQRLPAVREAAVKKGWPESALAHVEDYFNREVREQHGMGTVIINDEYLLVYVIGHSWWHPAPFLCEEFLLNLHNKGDFARCLVAIEELAKDAGCGAVCIGTGASPSNAVYSRLLNRHGYKTVAYQLVKEI